MGSLGIWFFFAAIFFLACSGFFSVRAGRLVALAGSLSGLTAVVIAFSAAAPLAFEAAWQIPGARFAVAIDQLAAAFLLPVFIVPMLGTFYAGAYVPRAHPSARRTRIFYGLLAASMGLVVGAADAVLLLVAWEVMALSAFMLILLDDHDPQVRKASWVYLLATHLGSLCLLAGFVMLGLHSGTFALKPVQGLDKHTLEVSGFLLLAGFGMKAGMMPLHFWLPSAHANAPSHVSAVLSGVMLKMGIYGLLRTAWMLKDLPPSAGLLLLGLGAVGAVLGAAMAVLQSDIKRLLAYSSVDNMGIVVMALGLAVFGRATGRDDLLALGLAGAVLHVWNHALFKPALFFCAGAVIHATHTRSMDRLGGLARVMPSTARVTFICALALAGLPPLNGFMSEFLIYLGFFRSSAGNFWPSLAAPALAMTGALSVVAMLKLYGTVFLGNPRQPLTVSSLASGGRPAGQPPLKAHDPSRAMTLPSVLLALGCLLMVPATALLLGVMGKLVDQFACHPVANMASFVPLSALGVVLSAMLVIGALGILWQKAQARAQAPAETWGCGYAAPGPRIQYTATSLSEILSQGLARLLLPPRNFLQIRSIFPRSKAYASRVREPLLDRVLLPLFGQIKGLLPWFRWTQQGVVQNYILYILMAVLLLLWVG